MILITFNQDRIINVIEAPDSGTTQTNHRVLVTSIIDAEIFFFNKQFDLSKITNYKKIARNEENN